MLFVLVGVLIVLFVPVGVLGSIGSVICASRNFSKFQHSSIRASNEVYIDSTGCGYVIVFSLQLIVVVLARMFTSYHIIRNIIILYYYATENMNHYVA